jgi:osmotically inducible lipoprotein OsmB
MIMKKSSIALLSLVTLQSLALNSCDTPTGQGAAAGAGAGAIIGNIAGRGGGRSTLVGAAIGAATGALIGHAIQEDRARQYGPPPAGGYPYARYAGRPGLYRSPYTGKPYDLRDVPPGGLTRDVDTGQLFRRP